jgi:hypothetical protein
MSQSEVERHKRYEHPVPVSPFEEKGLESGLSKNNSNMNIVDLQRMRSDVTTGKGSNSNNNDSTTVGGRQMRKVHLECLAIEEKERH